MKNSERKNAAVVHNKYPDPWEYFRQMTRYEIETVLEQVARSKDSPILREVREVNEKIRRRNAKG